MWDTISPNMQMDYSNIEVFIHYCRRKAIIQVIFRIFTSFRYVRKTLFLEMLPSKYYL